MGRLLGIQSSTSLLAPFFGTTADKRGYRRLIQFCLLLDSPGLFYHLCQSIPTAVHCRITDSGHRSEWLKPFGGRLFKPPSAL